MINKRLLIRNDIDNLPEFIPMDNIFNNDLKLSHKYHCQVTVHLYIDKPRKYSSRTLLRVYNGTKMWEDPIGASNTDRTVKDLYITFSIYDIIYDAEGRIVPDIFSFNSTYLAPK